MQAIKINVIRILKEEIRLSIFTDDINLYIEIPKVINR